VTHHLIFATGLSAAVALLIGATPSVQGASFVFAANLSGAADDPPVASPGSGSATVTYDSLVQTLRVQFSVFWVGRHERVASSHLAVVDTLALCLQTVRQLRWRPQRNGR